MPSTFKPLQTLAALALTAIPTLALAHATQEASSDFMAGFTHPIFGLDHLLAMLAVGIVSTQLAAKRAIWTLPATFVLAMIAGGYAGMSGTELGGVEMGIALSVTLLGTSIFFGSKLPQLFIYLLVAAFGVYHGFAHGAEMPEQAHAEQFVGGFVLATIVIHLAGVSIGLFTTTIRAGHEYLRFAGGVIAGLGISFILAALGAE